MGPAFERFIGIDYSGAKGPNDPVTSIRVFSASAKHIPSEIRPPDGRHWSRKTLFEWLRRELEQAPPTLVGLDHGLSFPKIYFLRHQLRDWPAFLAHVLRTMPTHQVSIETLRHDHRLQSESPHALRLCEAWTSSAKSVFQFDIQGSVAKSTYAGLPWIALLRQHFERRIFFWPFDGSMPPDGVSVICETYPALYKRRYRRSAEHGPDAHDAFAIARWMQDMQQRGVLGDYFLPPLTAEEWALTRLEGWILGVT